MLINSYTHNKSIKTWMAMIYPKFRTVVLSRKRERETGQGGVYRNLQFPVMFISHIKKKFLTCFLQILRSDKARYEYLHTYYIIYIMYFYNISYKRYTGQD